MIAAMVRTENGWGVRIGVQTPWIPMLLDESYQVASNVVHAINTGAVGDSECDEVARAILARAGQS